MWRPHWIVVGLVAACVSSIWWSLGTGAVAQQREPLSGDRLIAAVQEICPVSGQELGSHGPPVKVRVGEGRQEVFLCCDACADQSLDEEHWRAIHVNFATAQASCPIMKHKLPDGAAWTIVQGRVFFVCCPPCIPKIQAEPQQQLAGLEQAYRQYLNRKRR